MIDAQCHMIAIFITIRPTKFSPTSRNRVVEALLGTFTRSFVRMNTTSGTHFTTRQAQLYSLMNILLITQCLVACEHEHEACIEASNIFRASRGSWELKTYKEIDLNAMDSYRRTSTSEIHTYLQFYILGSRVGSKLPSTFLPAIITDSMANLSLTLNIFSFKTARRNREKAIDSSTPFCLMAIKPPITHRIVMNIATPYAVNKRLGEYSYAVVV